MYTLGAIAATRPLLTMRQIAPAAKQLAPATKLLATAKVGQTSTSTSVPQPTSPQPIVLVIPTKAEEKSVSSEAPTKWYRSAEFIGGIASLVIVAVLGLIIQKVSDRASSSKLLSPKT